MYHPPMLYDSPIPVIPMMDKLTLQPLRMVSEPIALLSLYTYLFSLPLDLIMADDAAPSADLYSLQHHTTSCLFVAPFHNYVD